MTPQEIVRHARAIFFEHPGPPMYPAPIYDKPVLSWETLYGTPGGGDPTWQDLVRVLLRLGWQPPPPEGMVRVAARDEGDTVEKNG